MRRPFMIVGLILTAGLAAQRLAAQATPEPPLRFIYRVPASNDGVFGCAGVVGVDVALQGCTTLAPTANDFVWTLEFQPLPALKLGRLEIPIGLELSAQHVVPHFGAMHFEDRARKVFAASNQTSARFAIGYDSYFYDRHLWGNRTMLKAGGACLLTRALDLNPRREGCDDLDLDNWFVKALFARTILNRSADRTREIGYVQASVYYEMPDHDFASKPDESGYVEVFNDDGMDVTFADLTFFAKAPAIRIPGGRWRLDVRPGGGVGLARQIQTGTYFHGDLLATVTLRHNLAISGGGKFTHRNGSYSGLTEDNEYWTGQAYIQWRPDVVVFWDHRY